MEDESQSKPSLNIADLFRKDTTEMKAQVEYQYGIFFHMNFMARSDLQKLMKECTIYKYNPSTRTREPSLDAKKLIERFCSRAIFGWHGMTPRNLSRLIPMKNIPEDKMDDEIPFSQEQLVLLVENSAEVDAFLQTTVTDVNFFNESHEDELKNSEASQSGS